MTFEGAGMTREPLNRQSQDCAIDATQRAVWRTVVERFRLLQDEVQLKQADLSRRLGVSNPQIHIWLSDHRKMTLKAAARLLAAMDAGLVCSLSAEDPSEPGSGRRGRGGGEPLAVWLATLQAALSFGGVV